MVWVLKAWAISAVVTVVVLFLIARFTTWGRQFWRVTGAYFTGRQSLPVWGLLARAAVPGDALGEDRRAVHLQQQRHVLGATGAPFRAMTQSKPLASMAFGGPSSLNVLLIVIFLTRTLLDLYLMQRFIIRWRVWLTDRLTGDWLDGQAYYRGRFVDCVRQRVDRQSGSAHPAGRRRLHHGHGTADQHAGRRDWADVVVRRRHVRRLGGGVHPILVESVGPLTFFGVTLPKALFWFALALRRGRRPWCRSGSASPMIRLTFRNEATNAAFRYALVRMRDAAEAVGLYRGERTERAMLSDRFAAIITNYRAFVRRGVAFTRLELDDQPDRLPVADHHPGSATVRGRAEVGRRQQSSAAFSTCALVALLPRRLRLVRRLPGRDHPPRWAGDGQRRGKGATAIGSRGQHAAARGAEGRGRELPTGASDRRRPRPSR